MVWIVVAAVVILAAVTLWLFPHRRGITCLFVVRPDNYPVIDEVLYFFAAPSPPAYTQFSQDPTGPWRIHMWAQGNTQTNQSFIVERATLTTTEGVSIDLVPEEQPPAPFMRPKFPSVYSGGRRAKALSSQP